MLPLLLVVVVVCCCCCCVKGSGGEGGGSCIAKATPLQETVKRISCAVAAEGGGEWSVLAETPTALLLLLLLRR